MERSGNLRGITFGAFGILVRARGMNMGMITLQVQMVRNRRLVESNLPRLVDILPLKRAMLGN